MGAPYGCHNVSGAKVHAQLKKISFPILAWSKSDGTRLRDIHIPKCRYQQERGG